MPCPTRLAALPSNPRKKILTARHFFRRQKKNFLLARLPSVFPSSTSHQLPVCQNRGALGCHISENPTPSLSIASSPFLFFFFPEVEHSVTDFFNPAIAFVELTASWSLHRLVTETSTPTKLQPHSRPRQHVLRRRIRIPRWRRIFWWL